MTNSATPVLLLCRTCAPAGTLLDKRKMSVPLSACPVSSSFLKAASENTKKYVSGPSFRYSNLTGFDCNRLITVLSIFTCLHVVFFSESLCKYTTYTETSARVSSVYATAPLLERNCSNSSKLTTVSKPAAPAGAADDDIGFNAAMYSN